ncbi:hypothetical protein D5086_002016 [Populus alba]|uniref:Uncharacterized protein n=1 Tax=Populus alba TaxID=43335 RepID=A0ACC4D0C1_POPAL
MKRPMNTKTQYDIPSLDTSSVAPSVVPKRRLLLDMQGTTDAGGCYFRRGGNDIRVLSAAADLCLLLVARAIDGFVIARELE